MYLLLSATVSFRDYEPLFLHSEYMDLANKTTPLKLCYNITIFRLLHCNTTLRFLSSFRIQQFTTKFPLNASPSSAEIFIEECGMYVLLMLVEILKLDI